MVVVRVLIEPSVPVDVIDVDSVFPQELRKTFVDDGSGILVGIELLLA